MFRGESEPQWLTLKGNCLLCKECECPIGHFDTKDSDRD